MISKKPSYLNGPQLVMYFRSRAAKKTAIREIANIVYVFIYSVR